MTIQDLTGAFYWPHMWNPPAAFGFSVGTLDAANEKQAFIFQIPDTGNCVGVSFSTRTVSITAGPLAFVVSLQTVDSSGNPTGTLYHANATANQNIADTDDNKQFEVTFTSFAVTGGDVVAIVIAAPASGTFDVDIARGSNFPEHQLPYSALFTASWSRSINRAPVAAIKYDDGYHYVPGMYPAEDITNVIFNNTDTPDEIGAILQMPFPFRVYGGWLRIDADNAFQVILYDGADVAQLTYTFQVGARGAATRTTIIFNFGGSTFDVPKDTNVRLVIKPTTSSDIRIEGINVVIADLLTGYQGGTAFHQTSRVDGGSWTELTTRMPFMGLLIKGVDDGVGGGGGGGLLVHPGMSGGMRG